MNTMAKYALMGVGFTAMSTALGADAVRTAQAAPPVTDVNVENTPSVSVVSMPTTPLNVAGNVGITGNVGIVGTPTVNVASVPGTLNVAGNVGLVSGTSVLADPSQVVTLQSESPGTLPPGGGPAYGGSTTSGKTALVVQNANEAQQPFGVTIPFQPQGSPTGMAVILFTVPAHKRAVVERIAVTAGIPTGQQPSFTVFFGAALPPGSPAGALEATEQLIPSRLTTGLFGLDGYAAAQSVRYYIEPGANVFVLVQWQTQAPSDVFPSGTATASGYFVDAP